MSYVVSLTNIFVMTQMSFWQHFPPFTFGFGSEKVLFQLKIELQFNLVILLQT